MSKRQGPVKPSCGQLLGLKSSETAEALADAPHYPLPCPGPCQELEDSEWESVLDDGELEGGASEDRTLDEGEFNDGASDDNTLVDNGRDDRASEEDLFHGVHSHYYDRDYPIIPGPVDLEDGEVVDDEPDDSERGDGGLDDDGLTERGSYHGEPYDGGLEERLRDSFYDVPACRDRPDDPTTPGPVDLEDEAFADDELDEDESDNRELYHRESEDGASTDRKSEERVTKGNSIDMTSENIQQGKVKCALSGDTLVLTSLNDSKLERTISLAFVGAPRMRRDAEEVRDVARRLEKAISCHYK